MTNKLLVFFILLYSETFFSITSTESFSNNIEISQDKAVVLFSDGTLYFKGFIGQGSFQLEEKIEKLIKRKISFYLATKFLSTQPHIVLFNEKENR